MNVEVWGWTDVDVAGISNWRKLHVDTEGDLQIDVLSSELPDGAATLAKQTDQLTKLNSIITKLAGGLPATLRGINLRVREANPITGFATSANQATIIGHIDGIEGALGQCYGWVGDVWYHLLVESATNPNLRVKLYDGANALSTETLLTTLPAADRGLVVSALIHGYLGANAYPISQEVINVGGKGPVLRALVCLSALYGFNGTDYDQIHTYGTGILKVGRAPIGATTLRVTATGQVGTAAAKKLYWISCSPDAPGAEFELTDATEALQTVVFDHFDPDKHSEIINLDPPMEFANGIWVEKFDHIHSLVFCYE